MNKLFIIKLAIVTFGLYGCDPAFNYYITAQNGSAIIETFPSIESIYCSESPEKLCDYAKSHRIDDKNDSAVYKINQGEQLKIHGGVGTKASPSYFPFKYIKIITKGDTLIFTDKAIFLERFVRKRKSNQYFFEL